MEAYDDGSSTESEYYEDADYEGLELDADAEEDEVHGEAAAMTSAFTHPSAHSLATTQLGSSSCVMTDEQDSSLQPPSTSSSVAHAASDLSAQAVVASESTAQCLTVTLEPSIVTSACRPDPPFDFDCLHCQATIRVTQYPSLFHRYNMVCRCCRIVSNGDSYEVRHEVHGYIMIRLCAACYAQNGPAFLAMIATVKPPAELQCSGCKQTKPMKLFHKHQRMEKPWEAVPSQAHFCAVCVPPGAIVAHNTVVPYEIKCAKCQEVRSRKAFKREFDRFGSSAEKLILEEFICSRCDNEACALLRQLSCSICLKLLAPKCFPKGQRKPARSLGHKKPTYTCKACLGAPLTPAMKSKMPMVATPLVVKTLDCSNCDKTLSETDFPPSQRESRDPKLQEESADDEMEPGEMPTRYCRQCLLGPLLKKDLKGLLMCTDCCIPQEASAFSKTQQQMKLRLTRRCMKCIAAPQLLSIAATRSTHPSAGPGSVKRIDVASQEERNEGSSLKRKHEEIQVAET